MHVKDPSAEEEKSFTYEWPNWTCCIFGMLKMYHLFLGMLIYLAGYTHKKCNIRFLGILDLCRVNMILYVLGEVGVNAKFPNLGF